MLNKWEPEPHIHWRLQSALTPLALTLNGALAPRLASSLSARAARARGSASCWRSLERRGRLEVTGAMNWVGGVRNRIKLKQQKRQQKEFFEKRKLKSKLKLLEPPVSPQQNSSVSWDLLTLHIVNRIAAKKESVDASNKVIQVNMMNDRKVPIRRHNIELPMSPCSTPSQIFLEESQCSTQKNEWNSRKQFTNTSNLRYGELSTAVESNLMEYNILDNSGPSTNKFNGFPQKNAWLSGKNLRTKPFTMWDPTYGDQELLQKHFICDGTSPRIEIIERAVLTNKENLVTHHNSLPRHSNARLSNGSLTENSSIHSNNGEKYISFSAQEAFPLSQNFTTQLVTGGESLISYDRDFPPTQCYSLERIQPAANFKCQEKFMHCPLVPVESDFNTKVPSNRSDIYRNLDVNHKVAVEDTKNECIFIQPKSNLFKGASEKDFSENNLLDKQFLESSIEESSIQKNVAIGPGEAWRRKDCRRKVYNDSLESSQSPSYSPKETESCSAFSDISELDVQLGASVVNKGQVPDKHLGDKPGGENGQSAPFHESSRETNSASRYCPFSIYSDESNLFNIERKENHDQFVPSSMYCKSETYAFEQNVVCTKSFQGQDAWTQTECSLTHVAIQCNLSESHVLPGKELRSLEDNQNYFVHTTTGHYSPSNRCLHYLDKQAEDGLNIGCRLPLEVVDEPKCLKAKSEGKSKISETYSG
ncbi:regulator of DNA class I crossover intermediates 1 [Rhinoraja longicauda]